jgi:4-hydroxybenzoate polyprenyltransferase/phosphoserine phosphatase
MLQPPDSGVSAGEDRLVPLCVDLDGTLIRTDILWESVIQLWRSPAFAARATRVLLSHGKAAFKTALAEGIAIDPAALPYREDVVEFLRSQHGLGRDIILATATHRLVAQRVADHLGLFRRVFSTDSGVNLSGARKQAALESAYGRYGFDYIGDHRKDLPVFSAARKTLLVDPSPSLLTAASAVSNVSRVFSENQSAARNIARALRIHQWSKNVLLAVPLLAAHLVLDLRAWASLVTAFFGFSFVASATYLLNDLVDLRADRTHPKKRLRPLASGRLPIYSGLILAVALGLLGFVLSAAFLPLGFVAYLAAYVALTIGYSLDLKRRLLVDVLALAVLYTLRILAGGAAIGVGVSEWLLMFSLFIFISLAFLKRVIELEENTGTARVPGRGYSAADLETMRIAGISSGLISVMVFSLYIGSPVVNQLYRSPQVLWLMCPLLIYWISRIWFMAARGEVHHDPVVFALLDWRSYAAAACGLGILVLAKVGPAGIHL